MPDKKTNDVSKPSKEEEMINYSDVKPQQPMADVDNMLPSNLPKEAQEKLKEIKAKLDKFKKKVVDKFDKYIVGVSLLPPPKPKEGEQLDKSKIHVLVLVDDSDSKKMPKYELKTKITTIVKSLAEEVDPN